MTGYPNYTANGGLSIRVTSIEKPRVGTSVDILVGKELHNYTVTENIRALNVYFCRCAKLDTREIPHHKGEHCRHHNRRGIDVIQIDPTVVVEGDVVKVFSKRSAVLYKVVEILSSHRVWEFVP